MYGKDVESGKSLLERTRYYISCKISLLKTIFIIDEMPIPKDHVHLFNY